MWVYQESVPNALTAPSGALPAAQPAAAPRDTAPFRKESASPSDTLSGPERDGCPGAAKAAARSRTLPRDCAVLAASYLFGTLLAGVVLARCQSSEQLLVSAYLDSWKGLFTLDEPGAVWRLFGAEYLTVAGGATVPAAVGLVRLRSPDDLFVCHALWAGLGDHRAGTGPAGQLAAGGGHPGSGRTAHRCRRHLPVPVWRIGPPCQRSAAAGCFWSQKRARTPPGPGGCWDSIWR